jgi:transketolase
MKNYNKEELLLLSKKVREDIIKMSALGGAFTGAALSCTDVITYLYTNYLNTGPGKFDSDERDYFFLSKGHVVPVLYGLFAELGWLDKERLNNHLKTNDYIYWHPNTNIDGIDFHSGSLGHGLPVAMGVAKDIKFRNGNNKVVVMTGDGELNEGSNWEAIMTSAALKLDNLILIVDRNKFQANMQTEDLVPMGSYLDKFKAFGWNALTLDGHNFDEINDTFSKLDLSTGKPTVIVAETVRGKGVSSIEARADKWFVNFSEDEAENAIKELN